MPPILRFALTLLLGAMGGAACARSGLPLAELYLNGQRITVEVAHTPPMQRTGLMHRQSLPENQGMAFVHGERRVFCMWMKNTPIPLSVAFLDEEGRILNIADMQPDTTEHHCSSGPAQHALEMNLGWFSRHDVKAGDTVQGWERLPAWQPY